MKNKRHIVGYTCKFSWIPCKLASGSYRWFTNFYKLDYTIVTTLYTASLVTVESHVRPCYSVEEMVIMVLRGEASETNIPDNF